MNVFIERRDHMTVMTEQEFADAVFEIAAQVQSEFKPSVFLNEDGDCVEFFVSKNEYYAKRIDDYLTLYLEEETGEIAGFVVKNITRILDNVSAGMDCSFVIRDGEMCLEAMFAAMVWSDDRRIHYMREYRRVASIAKSYNIDKVRIASILNKAGIAKTKPDTIGV
jgi:hypothetical protein